MNNLFSFCSLSVPPTGNKPVTSVRYISQGTRQRYGTASRRGYRLNRTDTYRTVKTRRLTYSVLLIRTDTYPLGADLKVNSIQSSPPHLSFDAQRKLSKYTLICHILFISLLNNNTGTKPIQRIPMMEIIQEEFQVRVYLKTELAQLYAPHLDPEAALRKMRKWIHRNPELYDELYAGTEGKNEQAYSKRQVAIIVRYLDAP